MPDAAPSNPMTSTEWTSLVRKQVIAQLASASLPAAATEGRVFADTTNDRLTFDTASALVPGPNWSSAGRVGWVLADSTNRSIPTGTGTFTALTFATKTTDPDGFFSAPGTTVTIPSNLGGLYVMTATATWASSPGANSIIEFLVNSVTAYRTPIGAATQMTTCMVSCILALPAASTVAVRVSQGSGGAINVNPSSFVGWRLAA